MEIKSRMGQDGRLVFEGCTIETAKKHKPLRFEKLEDLKKYLGQEISEQRVRLEKLVNSYADLERAFEPAKFTDMIDKLSKPEATPGELDGLEQIFADLSDEEAFFKMAGIDVAKERKSLNAELDARRAQLDSGKKSKSGEKATSKIHRLDIQTPEEELNVKAYVVSGSGEAPQTNIFSKTEGGGSFAATAVQAAAQIATVGIGAAIGYGRSAPAPKTQAAVYEV